MYLSLKDIIKTLSYPCKIEFRNERDYYFFDGYTIVSWEKHERGHKGIQKVSETRDDACWKIVGKIKNNNKPEWF